MFGQRYQQPSMKAFMLSLAIIFLLQTDAAFPNHVCFPPIIDGATMVHSAVQNNQGSSSAVADYTCDVNSVKLRLFCTNGFWNPSHITCADQNSVPDSNSGEDTSERYPYGYTYSPDEGSYETEEPSTTTTKRPRPKAITTTKRLAATTRTTKPTTTTTTTTTSLRMKTKRATTTTKSTTTSSTTMRMPRPIAALGEQCNSNVPEIPPYTLPQNAPASCDQDESSVMCLPNSPNLVNLLPVPIKTVLELQNCWRRTLNNPPPSTPLPDLKWDKKLQLFAERWAAQCQMPSDRSGGQTPIQLLKMPAHNGLPNWPRLGENICWGSDGRTWGDCISARDPSASYAVSWGDEIKFWQYGKNNYRATPTAGRYNQMINQNTLYVGCGYAVCQDVQQPDVLVCVYGPSGNRADEQEKPYIAKDSKRRRRFFDQM